MSRLPRTPAAALLAALLVALCAPPASPQVTPPEPRQEWLDLCREITASDQIYHGRGRLETLEARLVTAAEGVAAIGLRAALGQEYMKFGRWQDADRAFSEAIDLAADVGLDAARLDPILWSRALSHLQAAESANCIAHHDAASCIVPLRDGGVHLITEHTRQAARLFADFLSRNPRNIHAAWLLNLATLLAGDSRDELPETYRLARDAFAAESDFPLWRDVAPQLGVNAFDLAGGAVMDDFDGDGLLDLVSSTSDPCGGLKAFRNDGRGGFEDVSEAWGLDAHLGGLNLIHGDYDGDGRLDLYILRGAWLGDDGRIRNSLLRNRLDDRGVFVDTSRVAGIAEPARPTISAAFADYDRDGDLDLFVGNEGLNDEHGFASQLFRNDGPDADGVVRFTDVAAIAGVENSRAVKGVAWGDYDDDGWLDLYLSNIGANRLYRNAGDGTFEDTAPALGMTGPQRRSFATWFFDWDNDGDLDLFVGDYTTQTSLVAGAYFGMRTLRSAPVLYQNRGDGGFDRRMEDVGFDRSQSPMGANYGDLDNDGWLDIYLGTGDPGYGSLVPNAMYRNAAGARFEEVTMAGGFGHLQKGHGVAFGDLDNDGDQDLFHQLGGFYPGDAYGNVLFENPGAEGAWITLRLRGTRSDRFALGARVAVHTVERGGERTVYALSGAGGSFGANSMQLEIGLGDAEAIRDVVVRWPATGTEQRFRDLEAGAVYELIEGEVAARRIELPKIRLRSGE